ncbi:MAG: hypothetical protein HZB83_05415 [Deltaproteobacteria bacterium]|nr:hypothetical protein [Deltaproteobacteria bacterium]
MAQQVKTELVGMAAIAAVKAIYFTALGFGLYAMSNPPASAAFTSAKFWAAVGAGSLAAAAGVQAMFFGGAGGGAPSGSGGAAAFGKQSAGSLPMSLDSNLPARQNQNITVNIHNPLSDQNWQKIVEDNIVPALNDASNRNVNLVVKYA